MNQNTNILIKNIKTVVLNIKTICRMSLKILEETTETENVMY